MLISKWRPRAHRHFGTVFVPVVELELTSTVGRRIPFSFCVDSGASVSLLPQSAANLLGLQLTTGRSIRLGAVGGQQTEAWLHPIQAFVGNETAVEIPFAIANSDHVPGLLGRLGMFDQFEVTFDPVRRETRIRKS